MAMDELSPSPSPSPNPSASAGMDGQWAPHGQLLTGCLVALNVLIVLLIYFYFWRFFSRKGAAATEVDEASSAAWSPAVSPKARSRQEVERAIAALPVFLHSSSGGGGGGGGGIADDGGKAVECAICIAEFNDGEEGRQLPRCGHRFHARCVDMWFHFHTTCPLCRASVLASAEPKSRPLDTDTDYPA